MAKQRFFQCTKEFMEPFGQTIEKGSMFLYDKIHNEDWINVYYWDEEDQSAYPIYIPRDSSREINRSLVDKKIIYKLVEAKRKLEESFRRKQPENVLLDRKVMIRQSLEKFGVDIVGRPDGMPLADYIDLLTKK